MQMKRIRVLILTFIAANALCVVFNITSAIAEEIPEDYPPTDPGSFVDSVGTYFEIANSAYLNITLTSSETVHAMCESAPSMINLFIESNSSATSTNLSFSGFEPNTVYCRYQDDYRIEDFTTDSSGEYAYTQDISQGHHVLVVGEMWTIYIRPDGSVDPSTAPISVSDTVYTVTDNINEVIYIQKDNVVLDGNGHTLQGGGIYLLSRSGVTIKNFEIKNWYNGIYLSRSDGNMITGNTITNMKFGMYLYRSSRNTISNNTASSNSQDGIVMFSPCAGNTIIGNTLSSNAYHGIRMYGDNHVIIDNTASNNYFGIRPIWSYGNTISNNSASNNRCSGIGLYGSGGSTISGNNASSNDLHGIRLYYNDDGNTITGNTMTSNKNGIVLNEYCDGNNVSCNTITENYAYGVYLWRNNVGNTFCQNTIAENAWGIRIYGSGTTGNNVYHNNIIDNINQADDYNSATNDWHHPDLLEGNYWSDYPGVDDGSGTDKHAIAGDGIGDTDIPWPAPNYDDYPFTSESGWVDTTPPEITITIPKPFGLYIVGTALDFNATDAQSGVATIVGQLTNAAGEYQEVDSGFTPQSGVYTLLVVATDNRGNTAESDPVFFVVYDPEGGFATGGGWICPDEESTLPGGKATFGFVAKYKQDSSTGNLEFQYHDAEINLKSTTIDWLVISGVSAQFQGTATINGEGLYTFRVSAKDNDEPGVGSDEFDIKIWDGTDTEAGPLHKAKNILAGGNIVVHKK